jgi:hypothetical protein
MQPVGHVRALGLLFDGIAPALRGGAMLVGRIACLYALAACAVDPEVDYADRDTREYPGLFTPGSQWGAMAAAAGMPEPDAGPSGPSQQEQEQAIEDGINSVAGQDRCVGYGAADATGGLTEGEPVMTRGTLMVEFTTQPLGQNKTYTPTNVGAVWIEDGAKNHIKTLDVWADERLAALFVWRKRGCGRLELDAISGATRPDHGLPHEAMWAGDDLHGNPVPDGPYRLNIEVTETEGDYSKWSEIEFQKGTQAFSDMPPDHPAHKGLSITYAPMQ